MRVVFPLCLFLAPLVRGTLVSISKSDKSPAEIDLVDPATGQFKKIVDLFSYAPGPGVYLRNDNTIKFSTLIGDLDGCFITADLSTGKTQRSDPYPLIVFNSLAFDKTTSQTFVAAWNYTTTVTSLFELLPNQDLRALSALPGYSHVASTYSSSKHIFFFVARLAVANLLAISTVGDQEGTILYDVPLAFEMQSMVFDDTFGALYAWGVGNTNTTRHTILVSVDYTTGKILKTFFQSSTLSAANAACTINNEGTVIYSSLIDQASGNQAVIHTLELSSGKATQATTDRFATMLSFQ